MNKNKVTKIMLWPSRTLDLGTRGYAKLSAGVEIKLDEPVPVDEPKKIEEAFGQGRKIVQDELKKQYNPYKKMLKKVGEKK